MLEAARFPTHPSAKAEQALGEAIERAKGLVKDVFGNGIDWSAYRWDVTEKMMTKRRPGKGQQSQYLIFSQHSGASTTKKRPSYEDETPFDPPYSNLVKAYAVIRQHNNPVTKENHMEHIRAWRFLYLVSGDINHNPTLLTHRHFCDALETYVQFTASKGSQYNMGKYLSAISNFLDSRQICAIRINFRNTMPRPKNIGGFKQRKVAQRAGKQQQEFETKLPKVEAILGLSKLAKLDLLPQDEIVIRGMEILLALGLRVGELVALPIDALQTIDTRTKTDGAVTRHKLVYWAEKNGQWHGVWIPTYAVELVQRAFMRIKELTDNFRVQRKFIEDSNFTRLYAFRDYDPGDVVETRVVRELLGLSKTNTVGYLRHRGIEPARTGYWRVGDIEASLIEHDVERAPLFDKDGKKLALSQALFLLPKHFTHSNKATSTHDFQTLQLGQVDDVLIGRHTINWPTIFERYQIAGDDQQPLRLNSHQLRHWLNTLMQESRALSQLEIAALFGRKYLKDNEAYDHSGESIDGAVVATKMFEEHGLTREALSDFHRTFPLLSFEDAVAMKGVDLGAAHVTDVGMCFLDFAQEPCGKHLVCLRECDNYIRRKGNKKEIEEVTKIMKRTEFALAEAKKAVAKQYWGANKFVSHNEQLLAGCKKALSVESLDVTDGEEIRVFVDKRLK